MTSTNATKSARNNKFSRFKTRKFSRQLLDDLLDASHSSKTKLSLKLALWSLSNSHREPKTAPFAYSHDTPLKRLVPAGVAATVNMHCVFPEPGSVRYGSKRFKLNPKVSISILHDWLNDNLSAEEFNSGISPEESIRMGYVAKRERVKAAKLGTMANPALLDQVANNVKVWTDNNPQRPHMMYEIGTQNAFEIDENGKVTQVRSDASAASKRPAPEPLDVASWADVRSKETPKIPVSFHQRIRELVTNQSRILEAVSELADRLDSALHGAGEAKKEVINPEPQTLTQLFDLADSEMCKLGRELDRLQFRITELVGP